MNTITLTLEKPFDGIKYVLPDGSVCDTVPGPGEAPMHVDRYDRFYVKTANDQNSRHNAATN